MSTQYRANICHFEKMGNDLRYLEKPENSFQCTKYFLLAVLLSGWIQNWSEMCFCCKIRGQFRPHYCLFEKADTEFRYFQKPENNFQCTKYSLWAVLLGVLIQYWTEMRFWCQIRGHFLISYNFADLEKLNPSSDICRNPILKFNAPSSPYGQYF